jgi:hypothetical protein
MIAHNVYFALVDSSDAAKDALVAACKKYLPRHRGILFFACGTLQGETKRSVNVRDFDVSLHIIFDTLESHDAYQAAPLHEQFVEENKANWKQVRVFDSNVEPV